MGRRHGQRPQLGVPMTAVPILQGCYATATGDFVASMPVNREPVVIGSGLSNGYLRPAQGIRQIGQGPGGDRGAINWNDTCFRVMGTQLCTVDAAGAVASIGNVGAGDAVALDYSFDRLAINSGTALFYYDGTTLTQVTDPDLGPVIDMVWIAGYFATTDGVSIVVTELNDPFAVNPLKYGSSESDPDPIVGLMKVRNELYALNRDTIQAFTNIGGDNFPFAVNPGGQVQKGCVGTRAKAYFADTFAFVGGGRNEALGVYVMSGGNALKISNSEVDELLAGLTIADAAAIECETRVDLDEQRLLVHLPTCTLVYFVSATRAAGENIWCKWAAGVEANEAYRGRHAVQVYGLWMVGDTVGRLGVLDSSISTRFGDVVGSRVDTKLIFDNAKRGIISTLELIGTPGTAPDGVDPVVFISTTQDGLLWSVERTIKTGKAGQRNKRVQIRLGRRFDLWAGVRLRTADAGMMSVAVLNAEIEGLG